MVRILILDTDICLRNVLREVLEQEGYDVMEACNDYEGLPHTQAQPSDLAPQDIRYLVAF
jgi:CheY-like chemotaxis protein